METWLPKSTPAFILIFKDLFERNRENEQVGEEQRESESQADSEHRA